jgi:Fic family protein
MPGIEKRRWSGDLGAYGGRKTRASYTFEAFIPDRIAGLDLTLEGDVLNVVSEAERAIDALNREPPLLEDLEVLARQLLRAESVASSRIEGLVLSHRRLARASFGGAQPDLTAESVLGNIRAMDRAVALGQQADRLTTQDIQAVHRELLAATRDAAQGGTIRTVQNWIGGHSDGPRDAEFVPPPPEHVPALLDDLCEFANRDDLPAVVQAAIVHAQFETIHPFADGNGRVGRCLIHVVLRRRRLARQYVPPVSLVLAGNARAYVAGLTDYRSGRISQWCGLFASATRTAGRGAQRFADAIQALQGRWIRQSGAPRKDSAAIKLIQRLPAHPIVDAKTVEQLCQCSNQAARLAVLQLEKADVLRRLNVGKRNRAWEAGDLFELLNDFERDLATAPGQSDAGRPVPAP